MLHLASAACMNALLAASMLLQPGTTSAAVGPDIPLVPVASKEARLQAACADANSDYERSELGCPVDEVLDTGALPND